MGYETITFEVDGHVGWLTLNRPERLNAFTAAMNREVIAALKEAAKDENVRAVVLTGAGRAFCSGEDLKETREDTDYGKEVRTRYNPMVKQMAAFEKPLIAAVNGAAAGAGMSLALACDFRIASDKAFFSEAFIHIGLVPDTGNLYYLPRLVGYAKALEMVTFGDKLSADEALGLGLVTKVAAADDFKKEVSDFAAGLAEKPTKAFGLIKRYMQQSFENPLDKMLEYEAFAQRTAGLTDDHQEGIAAFAEKRQPEYKGK